MKKILLYLILTLGLYNFSIAQNGLNFDGTNDVVQTNYSGVLGSADRTFEAWIFVAPDAPTSPLAIIDYGLNVSGSRNTFSVSGSRQLTFISGGGTNANISSPANSVEVNRWTHVALVIDAGTGFLYVDGIQVGIGSLSDVDTPANQDLKIGQRVNGGSIPFHGNIDEVRIWSAARSQAELQTNMNNELCSTHPDLQLYLRFNQGIAGGDNATITEAVDDSGNSYIATLTSFMLSDSISNWVNGAALTPGFSSSSEIVAACDSYFWSADSTTYDTSGNFSTIISSGNINGCDSLVSIDLTISSANDLAVSISSCDSYTWGVTGQTYTSSATIVEPQVSAEGCPFDYTLNLTITPSSFDTTSITSCDQYTWATNGEVYTTSGLYTEMYPAANGCDSMVTLNLTIINIDTSITYDGNSTVTSNEDNASYQWLDCNNAFTAISGATSQDFLVPSNGNFAVEITTNGCTDTSACILVDGFTNLADLDAFGSISLFPNPTKSNTTLSFGKQMSNINVIVSDVMGRTVNSLSFKNIKETMIDIEGSAGIYFIQITEKDSNQIAILRVVKE